MPTSSHKDTTKLTKTGKRVFLSNVNYRLDETLDLIGDALTQEERESFATVMKAIAEHID